MKLDQYELNRLSVMIRDSEHYKRTHNGQEMMIVLSDCGLQGFALNDRSVYPIIWRSDKGIVVDIEPEQTGSIRDFITRRFAKCV